MIPDKQKTWGWRLIPGVSFDGLLNVACETKDRLNRGERVAHNHQDPAYCGSMCPVWHIGRTLEERKPDLNDPIEHVEMIDHQNNDCGGVTRCRVCWLKARRERLDHEDKQ